MLESRLCVCVCVKPALSRFKLNRTHGNIASVSEHNSSDADPCARSASFPSTSTPVDGPLAVRILTKVFAEGDGGTSPRHTETHRGFFLKRIKYSMKTLPKNSVTSETESPFWNQTWDGSSLASDWWLGLDPRGRAGPSPKYRHGVAFRATPRTGSHWGQVCC